MVVVLLPPARAEGALGGRWLEAGDRGEDVRDLQRALRRLGHTVSVDGRFGPATQRAVRRYERAERIDVDGEVSRGQGRGMVRRSRRARAAAAPARAPSARPRWSAAIAGRE
jgi:peptidoglycan hydrolase-like protein with peptidoglycan-binding domain